MGVPPVYLITCSYLYFPPEYHAKDLYPKNIFFPAIQSPKNHSIIPHRAESRGPPVLPQSGIVLVYISSTNKFKLYVRGYLVVVCSNSIIHTYKYNIRNILLSVYSRAQAGCTSIIWRGR